MPAHTNEQPASTDEDVPRKRAGESTLVGKPTLAESWGQPQQSKALACGQCDWAEGAVPGLRRLAAAFTHGWLATESGAASHACGEQVEWDAWDIPRKRARRAVLVGKPTLAESWGQPQQSKALACGQCGRAEGAVPGLRRLAAAFAHAWLATESGAASHACGEQVEWDEWDRSCTTLAEQLAQLQ